MTKSFFLITAILVFGMASCSSQTNKTMKGKTGNMMNEVQFWNIVSASLQNTNSQEAQETYLVKELEKLSPEEIIGFRLRTDKLMAESFLKW